MLQCFTGVSISIDQLIVGMSQNVTCISDSGVVERIEWYREGQVVVEATSVQQLELVLDPVSDTDHGVQISCIVTRSEQERANQSLNISVTGKSVLLIYFLFNSSSMQFHQILSWLMLLHLDHQWQGQSSVWTVL